MGCLGIASRTAGSGIKGPKNWEKWGLGTLIKHVRAQGWVPEDLLDEVEVLQR